jgi:tRNA uridine 5-carboxymethylaminomethyl modification enzyme
VDLARLAGISPEVGAWPRAVAEQVEIDGLYAVYLERQAEGIAELAREEAMDLPADLDYAAMSGLSVELRQKLERIRPETLGRAGRIDGMTPAALALIAGHVRRREWAAAGDPGVDRRDRARGGGTNDSEAI